jgi:hypothetical protein
MPSIDSVDMDGAEASMHNANLSHAAEIPSQYSPRSDRRVPWDYM